MNVQCVGPRDIPRIPSSPEPSLGRDLGRHRAGRVRGEQNQQDGREAWQHAGSEFQSWWVVYPSSIRRARRSRQRRVTGDG